MRTTPLNAGALLLCAALLAAPASAAGQSAETAYSLALGEEKALRTPDATQAQLRRAISTYERVVHRYPASAYSDNALWQAANIALLAYERFGDPADKRTGLRLLAQLRQQFPSSSLVGRIDALVQQFDAVTARPSPPIETAPAPVTLPQAATAPPAATQAGDRSIALREITRTPLPGGMRVTIELEAESVFRAERIEGPRRVFFDLKNVRPVAALADATMRFPDGAVREIRLGRHPQNTTRVVIDMEGLDSYSVFTLYEPFRLVIDFQRAAPAPESTQILDAPPIVTGPPAREPLPPVAPPPPASRTTQAKSESGAAARAAAPPLTEVPSKLRAPSAASANLNGEMSLARQLGLGVSRVVIDAGHGGHDPGAQANGVTEAELVLDVAQRLARLLQKLPGVEVVMTRDTDVFIPLEERTAIANREGADLFLSIHANAARNVKARGVETYFLNFAPNAEAEAIAARENAGSTRTMGNLPDIVKAIAMNNKINESKDFAAMVQSAMVRRLAARNRQLKDLGVKQAPFVVLIGAVMPSVLAEISFVTNKPEAQLLKSGAYRQQIAEALLDAIVRYQKSLKRPHAIATR
jgi:N-acetylmuramoyl-L-alanine amidase